MKPIEYYEQRTELENGFVVDCGWYKCLSKSGKPCYTDGFVRGGDHLLVYAFRPTGEVYKHSYPLYGASKFCESCRRLSTGKRTPTTFGGEKRVEQF